MHDGVLKIRQGIDLILFKPDVKHIPDFYTYRDIPPRYPYRTEPQERNHPRVPVSGKVASFLKPIQSLHGKHVFV